MVEPQLVTGPHIVVPYVKRNDDAREMTLGDYVFSAETGEVVLDDIKVKEVSLSLFDVPVFKTDGTLSASFSDPRKIDVDDRLKLDWSQAMIVFNLSEVKGLRGDVQLKIGDTAQQFTYQQIRRPNAPSYTQRTRSGDGDIIETQRIYELNYDLIAQRDGGYLAVPATALLAKFDAGATRLTTTIDLSLSGAQKLSIVPFAKLTKINLQSNWPHPGFDGPFPPDDREITEEGFAANWTIPLLRRGIISHGSARGFRQLYETYGGMSVNFVSPLDPYRTVNRALKYSVLFIGMVFLAYFLFEVIVGVPVHPAQYILIGLAQSIFYLLLLAFSERIGFTGAFAISAGATIAATSGYAGAVFGGRQYIAKAGAVFLLVYGLLYALMRMQDFALMIGALASFIAIAGTMYLTRNINWYGAKSAAA
ncbi:cell envelope integrity protein CreD [Litorimonas sp. RW-G-Af-16]|uniref:cell envelope integrity protein CreD n=1 Tax=Litorimonas sp. RW-G-Af-16 TaxID=3241168 RepID=UPI003AACF8BF